MRSRRSGDGETALELLTRNPKRYDAVALDVMLPGKDGFEVARELREAGQYVPILMLTARSRPEDVLRGFEAGADDYVSKPFELAILLARLSGLLRRREWLRLSQTAAQSAGAEVFNFSDKTIDFSKLELKGGRAHGAIDIDGGRTAALPDQARRSGGLPTKTARRCLGTARRHRHARDRQFHRPAETLHRRRPLNPKPPADRARSGVSVSWPSLLVKG